MSGAAEGGGRAQGRGAGLVGWGPSCQLLASTPRTHVSHTHVPAAAPHSLIPPALQRRPRGRHVCAHGARRRAAAARGDRNVRAVEPARAHEPAQPVAGKGEQHASLALLSPCCPATLHLQALPTCRGSLRHPLTHCWPAPLPAPRPLPPLPQKAAEYTAGGGKELNKITYISQVKARPPTFVAWASGSTPLSTASRRFVASLIRRQWGFEGVPLRVSLRHKTPRRERGRRGGGGGRR